MAHEVSCKLRFQSARVARERTGHYPGVIDQDINRTVKIQDRIRKRVDRLLFHQVKSNNVQGIRAGEVSKLLLCRGGIANTQNQICAGQGQHAGSFLSYARGGAG